MDPSLTHLPGGEGNSVSVDGGSCTDCTGGDAQTSSLAYHYNFNLMFAYSSFSCMKSRFLWIEIIIFVGNLASSSKCEVEYLWPFCSEELFLKAHAIQ